MKNKIIILTAILTCVLSVANISAQMNETKQIETQSIVNKTDELSGSGINKDNRPDRHRSVSSEYNKNEYYGGYLYEKFLNRRYQGVEMSYTRNITRYVGLTGGFSYGHTNSPEECCLNVTLKESGYGFTGGVQFKDNSTDKRFKPFAHAQTGLFYVRGTEYCSGVACNGGSFKHYSMIFGGGLDVRVGKRFDLRIIQADYKPSRNSYGSWFNSFRIGAGIVFH